MVAPFNPLYFISSFELDSTHLRIRFDLPIIGLTYRYQCHGCSVVFCIFCNKQQVRL